MKKFYFFCFILLFISVFTAEEVFFWKIPVEDKIIFLTFDDGPGPYTCEVLKILKKYNIKATFFVLGELVRIHKDVVKQILNEGHTIGSHTYSHHNFYILQKKFNIQKCKQILTDELLKTEQELKLIFGDKIKIKFLRMPNGYYRKWMDDIIYQFDYRIINWTAGYDWHNITEEEMLEKYKKSLSKGTIYLFHDGGKNRVKTVKVLEKLINYCFSEGYQFGVLSDWIK